MYLRSSIAFQVSHIFRVIRELQLKLSYDIVVFFFEHLGILSLLCLSTSLINAVVIHMVDEEQRQTFDPHTEQLPFFVQMRQYRLAYLLTAHIDVVHTTYHLALMQHRSVQQSDSAVVAIDALHAVTVLVFLQTSALLVDVKTVGHQLRHLLHAAHALLVEADASPWVTLAQLNAF